MDKERILVFASGGKGEDEGGSGFQEMVEQSQTNPPILDAEIVGVVSQYHNGGVENKAKKLRVQYEHWNGPFIADEYKRLVAMFDADYVMLSGWVKPVEGLNPATTVNIHPGPLDYQNPERHFGGPGMYCDHVHEAVLAAYKKGIIKQSAVTMHFVTYYSKDGYDRGPIISQWPVQIRQDDIVESLKKRVNERERVLQSYILNLVVQGYIVLRGGYVKRFCTAPIFNPSCD